jgi:hypothetical protein
MRDFSVVIPISEKDVSLLRTTLPSWFSLDSDDFLLCVDKPISKNLQAIIKKLAKLCDKENKIRIVEVERSSEWRFHQAHVRREGFHKAKYDVILTGDADLCVNENVYKAVNLVGEHNIGLVSLSKLHHPHGLSDYWREGVLLFSRNVVHGVLDKFMATTTFTGLYAFGRSYWLDSESEEEIRKLVNPKELVWKSCNATSVAVGEDTFLRDCMVQRGHRCVYLREIGAVDLRSATENLPYMQYLIGRYFAKSRRSPLVSVGRAFLRAQPYYLVGYFHERFERK